MNGRSPGLSSNGWVVSIKRALGVLGLASLAIVFATLIGCDASVRRSDTTEGRGQKSLPLTPTAAEVRAPIRPVAVATPEAVETVVELPPTDHGPRPAPTRQVQVGSEIRTVEYDCGDVIARVPVAVLRYGYGFLGWSPDGGGILFAYDGAVWLLDDTTGDIYRILEISSGPADDRPLVFGYYADISPVEEKVAYTTCEFPQSVPAGGRYPAVAYEPGPPSANYDIVIGVVGVIDKDGRHGITSNLRITKTSHRIDHYPVWSPDGIWIASLSMDRTPSPRRGPNAVFILAENLHVRRGDDSKAQTTIVSTLGRFDEDEPSSGGIALIPPVWSPDGSYISYYTVNLKGDDLYNDPYTYSLHNIAARLERRPDVTRSRYEVGMITLGLDQVPPRPSWSPDSQRIAFVADDGGAPGLFTALADGTDRQRVASAAGIREIAWSPDGSEILIVSDRPYLVFVSPDGGSRRELELWPALGEGIVPRLVAWSPDGSRIAIYSPGQVNPGQVIVTMDRDGGNPRPLNEVYLRRPAVDPAVCSVGIVVPEPEVNPGLVRDCETLLKSVETLAGDSPFRWRPDRPITRWVGVSVTSDGYERLPLRVRSLRLDGQQLRLVGHQLAGSIPPALGDLAALETLNLSGSGVSGTIPPALGKLTALTWLNLSNTDLFGILPRALANLTNLTGVDLTGTRLTGCIPRDFSAIWMDGSDPSQWRCPAASDQ